MRHGAEPLAGGGVRFALWAPQAAAATPPMLELLDAQGTAVASHWVMQPLTDGQTGDTGDRDADHGRDSGWLQATVPADAAGPGTLYRYRFVHGDGSLAVPDPASRCNPFGVHGPSMVVDARALQANSTAVSTAWSGRPWHEAVVYELHVGTFTPQGTLAAAAGRLPALQALGITAVELMPLAAFAGTRGWGYDGVLPYAVHAAYGTPADLRSFIDTAHGLGLMVLLDVVYNHFGPDGNYLAAWCPKFFDSDIHTPWGPAIRFDQPAVRSFFVQNALHWVETCGIDGLRLDAVHAIHDGHRGADAQHIVAEIAAALQAGPGLQRHVHLVLENDDNAARLLLRDGDNRPRIATAQWNDDLHHAAHVLASGETQGYYADYADATEPAAPLARALAEGFVYQGQASVFRHGATRGEPSAGLPSTAFVAFLQNHDQTGNRAFGDRLDALAPASRVDALLACLLLAPQVPMLFMGEEFAARTPFLYFCDFGAELGAAVASGRRAEFAGFAAFADPAVREAIPDPNAAATFAASRLDWAERDSAAGRRRLALVAQLLALRQRHLVPLLPLQRNGGSGHVQGGLLTVDWPIVDPARGGQTVVWRLRANFSTALTAIALAPGEHCIYDSQRDDPPSPDGQQLRLPPDGVLVTLQQASR